MNKITTYGGVLQKENDVLFDFSNSGVEFETQENITFTIDCIESDILQKKHADSRKYILVYIYINNECNQKLRITKRSSIEEKTLSFSAHQRVKIIKVSEAYMGIVCLQNLLQLPIQSVEKENKIKVEFIGASIVSGYGNDGPGNSTIETDWTKTWCSYLCERFNWEAMVHSYSCMGLVRDSYDDTNEQIGERRRRILGCDKSTVFDFNTFQASYVIINIGSNDFGDIVDEPFKTLWLQKIKELIVELFGNYGENVKIILVHGPMMSEPVRDVIKSVPELFNDQMERKKQIYTVPTYLKNDSFWGIHYHPTELGHKMMSDEMIPYFEQIINSI